jgi:hypothetical protein
LLQWLINIKISIILHSDEYLDIHGLGLCAELKVMQDRKIDQWVVSSTKLFTTLIRGIVVPKEKLRWQAFLPTLMLKWQLRTL